MRIFYKVHNQPWLNGELNEAGAITVTGSWCIRYLEERCIAGTVGIEAVDQWVKCSEYFNPRETHEIPVKKPHVLTEYGFQDHPWHNDAMPRAEKKTPLGEYIVAWVDYEDPKDSESNHEYGRYGLSVYPTYETYENQGDYWSYSTNCEKDLAERIKEVWELGAYDLVEASTGGGCKALEVQRGDRSFLITSSDGCDHPSDGGEFIVGEFRDGEQIASRHDLDYSRERAFNWIFVHWDEKVLKPEEQKKTYGPRPENCFRIPPYDGDLKKWCEEMHKRGLSYHWDDDPLTIIELSTDRYMFSTEEAEHLIQLVNTIYSPEMFEHSINAVRAEDPYWKKCFFCEKESATAWPENENWAEPSCLDCRHKKPEND